MYENTLKPLVEDFLKGKSRMLAAMGPSGSRKTLTVFGCAREPGMLLALLKLVVQLGYQCISLLIGEEMAFPPFIPQMGLWDFAQFSPGWDFLEGFWRVIIEFCAGAMTIFLSPNPKSQKSKSKKL
ncbi:unnamed protein product [Fraxinus pennsylvanica]|uniref:Kinesin motor domain-containing protein n=1 Tax=Fraxinus pennsylvanica TaxID=56036 RepID=A0AAD2E537_9LAMI|nr:unnamed protein product [Fraxinus pennsylvanica]